MEGTYAKRGEGAVYAAGLPLNLHALRALVIYHVVKIKGSERRPAGGLAISLVPVRFVILLTQ